MTCGVTTLVEGSLFAVADSVLASRPTSWIAPGLSGALAVPCYVLVSQKSALIIDTGVASHWDTIRNGLDSILEGIPDRALMMTRREPDAISNLPAIVERYALNVIFCGGVISPLDFFERVDTTSTVGHIRFIANSDVSWLKPGSVLQVGRLHVEVLPTTLRVLPKNHLYESQSRTLFGSDTWGLVPQSQPGPLEIVREDGANLSTDAIVRYLRHRFEWLAGIDTAPMQDEVAHLLSTRRIDRICSSYGCVIEGQALVECVLRRTVDALGILSGEPVVNRLTSPDYALLAAALETCLE